MGPDLTFFPGVPECFDELQNLVKIRKYEEVGIRLEHYVVSSGLKAILDGSRIAKHVKAIFGCEFDEEDGHISFPSEPLVTHKRPSSFSASTKGLAGCRPRCQ